MKTSATIATPDRRLTGAMLALAALLGCLALAGSPGSATAAPCPNEALRIAQGSTALPGCLALELASFPKKFSQPAFLPSFSRDGERVLYKVKAPVPGAPGYQHFYGDAHVASRGAQGWTVASTAPPDTSIVAGGAAKGGSSTFTPDLGAWTQLGATQSQEQAGVVRLYGGGLDGSFAPLSPLLVPIDDAGSVTAVHLLEVGGSSADLTSTVFRVGKASISYFSEDPRSDSPSDEPGQDRNSYLALLGEGGEPTLELLARDKDGVVYGGRCGAHLGAGEKATFNQGAISADGQRIFFSTRPAQPFDEEKAQGPVCDLKNGLRVLERTATPTGPVITEIAPGGGGKEAPGDDLFQAASADGTRVYFTSPRKLAASDMDAEADPCSAVVGASEGCDLYLYDANKPEGERIVQASAGEGPEAADVLSSIPAVSGDGSHAYFVAQGALTSETNPEGDTAQNGQPNLYLYEAETESLSFIATLSPGDAGGMWGTEGTGFGDAYAAPLYGPGLQGGGDGHVLAFASKAPLTEGDEDGGHRDVFRYDAASDTLERVSKAAVGGEDNGGFDASVNPAVLEVVEYNFNEATRWASEDGQTIGFATEEALVPGDSDEANNPYVWDAGQLGAVFAPVTEPPAAAPVGGQIAFSTTARLLPQDTDAAPEVYVAREGGGFPLPVAPTECDPLQEGSCRAAPPPSQAPGAPATTTFNGPGNAKEPTRCRKPLLKRRGRCVKRARRGKAKRAVHRRGGRR